MGLEKSLFICGVACFGLAIASCTTAPPDNASVSWTKDGASRAQVEKDQAGCVIKATSFSSSSSFYGFGVAKAENANLNVMAACMAALGYTAVAVPGSGTPTISAPSSVTRGGVPVPTPKAQ